jgi:hypothetical protein
MLMLELVTANEPKRLYQQNALPGHELCFAEPQRAISRHFPISE